jgi:phenylpropionate dioxygenase-like ring-hydroxylating dioxygenase large terminal subunit
MGMTIADPVAKLIENVKQPFTEARAMPSEVYTSDDFLKLELEHVFAKDWICVGRSSSLPDAGDYITYELAGQPIFVIRDKDGKLRAMSNVCLHRMSTLLHGTGSCKAIVCPYHAWSYNLDGSLRGAPAMKLNDGFCKDSYRLPQVRCEEWLGMIMVTLDPDAPPVTAQLSAVEGLIEDFGLEDYSETFKETHVWDTNWKILAENFMESYHLPICHAGTIGGMSKFEDMICPPGLPAFNYHTLLKDDTMPIALAHPDNTRLKGERRRTNYLLAIYPSLMISLTPGYFWYLSLHPQGVGQVHITFGGGMSPDFTDFEQAQEHLRQTKALLNRVNAEDRGCTEKVYRGACAGLSKPGHLSHLERPNYDFAQYLAERTGGFARTF